jgi:ribosomal protein S18 acetylase RimI-like enzyme
MTEAAVTLRKAEPSDLRAALDIVASRPAHFVPAVYPLIEADLIRHQALMAVADSRIVGFLVWRVEGREIELLWMAVTPDFERKGVGTMLLRHVLNTASDKTHVYLLTATTDSTIPGTAFNGTLYSNTIRFFKRRGFMEEKILLGHWGASNHALRLGLTLNRTKN